MADDHFLYIYGNRAADYHRLIGPEDVDQNLLPALERVTSLSGKRILDLGSGTGRLPLLLDDRAAQLVGLDLFGDMLRENKIHREEVGGSWGLTQADMRSLPVLNGWAEVVLAGWAIGHFAGWYGAAWQAEIGRVLAEIHRVAVPDGAIIILETLTTGSLTPAPPSEALAQYYSWLEQTWGFSRQEISTDYQFASVEEAANRTEFFFGSELSAIIRENNWDRLPEWTGVWGKQL